MNMKFAGLFCIGAAVLAEDQVLDQVLQSNRSLLSTRGRRLTAAKCEASIRPYGVAKGDYNVDNQCAASTPAVKLTGDADEDTDDGDNLAGMQADCCVTAAACSTLYINNGLVETGKTACSTAGNKVPSTLKCRTTDSAGTACAGVVGDAKYSTTIDAAHCCRQMCSDGFRLNGVAQGTTAKAGECEAGYEQISSTAACAGQSCVTATDKATCCQKKCSTGFVLHGVTKNTASAATTHATNDQNCVELVDKVSTTLFCAGASCIATDASTCCLQKCADGFQVKGGTATIPGGTTAKVQCEADLRVSPDAFCSSPTCGSGDASTCCETKCDKSASGFELHGGTTSGMEQCAKDLRVHPDEYCDGTACSASSTVCCQQKCSAGFKLKGATGSGTECAVDLTVHATAYCKGASCSGSVDAGTCCQQKCSKGFKLNGATTKEPNDCPKDTTLASDAKCAGTCSASTDENTCCNVKCTHKTTGFKTKGATTKEANECPKGELVATKGMCKGDCSSDDATTCCMSANNSTTTTDANGIGLAASAVMLVIVSAAF